MWGIYNIFKKEFQFGIREPSERKALEKLFNRIGKDAYKWRFEAKEYPKTKTVHCRRKYDVYIGRPSKWGNPFFIGEDGSRKDVIDKYEKDILSRLDLLADLHELRGKTLGCWCKPKLCHGDVLAKLANSLEVDNLNGLTEWFGKGCRYQTSSYPNALICTHGDNYYPGVNCNGDACPLKMPIKKIVQVTFAGNNEVRYDFFTDLDLNVGEDVVCHTVRGFGIGRVVGHVDTSTKARDWIVQRVDVERYKALVERDRQAREIDDMLG